MTKTSDAFSELPPRARRIHARREYVPSSAGTTSACAENTCGAGILRGLRRNYLRVRGEYKSSSDSSGMTAELPPRARRIRCDLWEPLHMEGTTSAHAENTDSIVRNWHPNRNYLRARGEYGSCMCRVSFRGELPPRTRRILETWMDQLGKSGTTSAHAENTGYMLPEQNRAMNYLRARGEYTPGPSRASRTRELPPRTRRIRGVGVLAAENLGTTSAHAENTTRGRVVRSPTRNYLRARGEYLGH